MEFKKNPNIRVGRNSSIYFAVGLNVMLFFTWFALEHKTYESSEIAQELIQIDHDFEEDIPITEQLTTPPPPAIPAAPEIITVVEDVAEIEESVIESTETSQEERIEEPIVEVEDVIVEEVEEDIEVPFAAVESVPVFPGCKGNKAQLKACFNEKVLAHVKKTFRYPEEAQQLGVQGKVYVMFIIDSRGFVGKIRTRGPDKSLETEAKRIISTLPQMIPGKQRDKPVNVPYAIPITFQLQQ